MPATSPQITILDRLPTNASGKVLKTTLREMVAAAQPLRPATQSNAPALSAPAPVPQHRQNYQQQQVQRRHTPIRKTATPPPLLPPPVSVQDILRCVLVAMPHLAVVEAHPEAQVIRNIGVFEAADSLLTAFLGLLCGYVYKPLQQQTLLA